MLRSTARINPPLIAAFSRPTTTAAAAAAQTQTLTLDRPIPTPTPQSQLFFILSHPNWIHSPLLHRLAPSLSPPHIADLLRSHSLPPGTALAFFDWIARRPGFRHSVDSHSALLHTLLRSDFLRPVEPLAISMIKSSTSADDLRSALHSFTSLTVLGFTPTIRCYNTLLMALARYTLIGEMNAVLVQINHDL